MRYLVLVSILLAAAATALADDLTRYTFPDAQPEHYRGEGASVEAYQKARGEMENLGRSDQLPPASYFALKCLADEEGNALAIYAQRRLVLLDWMYGTNTGKETAERLEKLAGNLSPDEASLTRQMAMTVLLRDNDFPAAVEIFKSLDPETASQFGFFALEIIQRGGQYGSEFTSSAVRQRPGVDEKDAQRRRKFAEFVADVYLPAMEKAVDSLPNRQSELEKVQIVVSLESTANVVHQVLSAKDLPDVAHQAIEELLPRTLDLWSKSLLNLHEIRHIDPTQQMEKIKAYRESMLPRLGEALEVAEKHTRGEFSAGSAGSRPSALPHGLMCWMLSGVGIVVAILVLALWLNRRRNRRLRT